uniref:Uncharacterized protein n=1 Tax=Triticum urartu TaxID=4572 RepID=A0A8R7TZU3_TRIUA
MDRECWTMERPMELIQSSFSLSESATKYMVSPGVESSKANLRLSTSSAPLTVRQEATAMTPRGTDARVTDESLNQKIFPCLSTNHRRRHVLMYSPCLSSHPPRSGSRQNSMPSVASAGGAPVPITARHRLAAMRCGGIWGSGRADRESSFGWFF